MSRLIRKSHNVSILLYHFVCSAKYRRAVIDEKVDQVLKEVCLDIADRYQIEFLKIGIDKDHVHFLVQSVPSYSPTKIITMIKSLPGYHRSRSSCGVVDFGRMATMWVQ